MQSSESNINQANKLDKTDLYQHNPTQPSPTRPRMADPNTIVLQSKWDNNIQKKNMCNEKSYINKTHRNSRRTIQQQSRNTSRQKRWLHLWIVKIWGKVNLKKLWCIDQSRLYRLWLKIETISIQINKKEINSELMKIYSILF